MNKNNTVRIGVIGIGSMGSGHVRSLLSNKVARAEVTAICDIDSQALTKFPQIKGVTDGEAFLKSGLFDAVLIATPHYFHTTLGIKAFEAGLHVLVEKPISVHKSDCERLIAAYNNRADKSRLFAAMFNQRTDPHYSKVKKMIEGGELGPIRRVSWIITDWFRTQAYYRQSAWRATWGGEGGGVLINQCPHNLDLMQWLFGLPKKVHAFCHFGKFHDIETEDSVSAYLEWADGATGVFVTTTGEFPGSNRLEIAAERGLVAIEGGKVTFTRNTVPTTEFSHTTKEPWSKPDTWHIDIPVNGYGGQHQEILQNFTNAILDGVPLIAPATEGINSVELGNAMILSTLLNKTIELPLDGAVYEQQLKKLIADAGAKKSAKQASR
jgi:predicted dehydrogenase